MNLFPLVLIGLVPYALSHSISEEKQTNLVSDHAGRASTHDHIAFHGVVHCSSASR